MFNKLRVEIPKLVLSLSYNLQMGFNVLEVKEKISLAGNDLIDRKSYRHQREIFQ